MDRWENLKRGAGLYMLGLAASSCVAILGEYDVGDASGGAMGTGNTGSSATTAAGSGGAMMAASAASAAGGGPELCQNELECDDDDVCTSDSCGTTGRCTHTLVVNVNDNDACTEDSCDPTTGAPVHTLDSNCCPHSVCSSGGPLHAGGCKFKDPAQTIDCVAKICRSFPNCCAGQWDGDCVGFATLACDPGSGSPLSCACAHSYCKTGPALDPLCDPCVHAVCSFFPSCCDPAGAWDEMCVVLTHAFCNVPTGADCQ